MSWETQSGSWPDELWAPEWDGGTGGKGGGGDDDEDVEDPRPNHHANINITKREPYKKKSDIDWKGIYKEYHQHQHQLKVYNR